MTPPTPEELLEAGAVRNIHVPGVDIEPGTEQGAEWFAGQVVEALAMEKWFAINGIVNLLDTWCPPSAAAAAPSAAHPESAPPATRPGTRQR